MKIKFTVFFIIGVLFFYIGRAFSVPPGRELVFEDGKMGKIIFNGKRHAEAGKKCDVCHPGLFKKKKGFSEIKYADHKQGTRYCFACHNGSDSFETKGNCRNCHVRKK